MHDYCRAGVIEVSDEAGRRGPRRRAQIGKHPAGSRCRIGEDVLSAIGDHHSSRCHQTIGAGRHVARTARRTRILHRVLPMIHHHMVRCTHSGHVMLHAGSGRLDHRRTHRTARPGGRAERQPPQYHRHDCNETHAPKIGEGARFAKRRVRAWRLFSGLR
jgi:hypothetical protein